jgi:hypothetical protein
MRKKLQEFCVFACETKTVHARIYRRVLTYLQEAERAENARQHEQQRMRLDEQQRVSGELNECRQNRTCVRNPMNTAFLYARRNAFVLEVTDVFLRAYRKRCERIMSGSSKSTGRGWMRNSG